MNDMIIPALMPKNLDDIANASRAVRDEVTTMQLDLMDGKYVKDITWPFVGGGKYDLQDAQSGNFEFPQWEHLNYELDLMVVKPEDHLEEYLSLGASRIIFHFASVANWQRIIDIDQVTRNFVSIGIAVTIYDDLQKVFPLIEQGVVDFVQVMGIARIGFQGEAFEEQSLGLIRSIKKRFPDCVISVDGAVSVETISLFRDAGASRFVSGSGVFGGGMIDENIQDLQESLEG